MGVLNKLATWFRNASRSSRRRYHDEGGLGHGSGTWLTVGGIGIRLDGDGERDRDGIPDSRDSDDGGSGSFGSDDSDSGDSGDSGGGSDD